MGRGSSKAGGGGGGGGGTGVTSVTVQSGATVQLDQPLVYGDKDKAVSGALRANLEAQEDKRLKAKSEYGAVFDEYGNQIYSEFHGSKGSIKLPYTALKVQDGTFTHNHPRGKGEEGCLGGTFSGADMNTFANNPIKTMRASAAEGTYSITKGNSFNSTAFKSYIFNVNKTASNNYSSARKKLDSNVLSGKILYSDYQKQAASAFNSYMVEIHNSMIAGQKQYGYSYTLERRD